MRTHLEFRSRELLDNVEEGKPKGEAVARFLAQRLPDHGYEIEYVHPEDWGWRVQVAHAEFPLWVGCGRYEEYPDGYLCFIEPSKPYVRRWLKRIQTATGVERLAEALESTMGDSGMAHDLRWWTKDEAERR